MYAKAHPFDYIPRYSRTKKVQCEGSHCRRVQTVYMKDGSVKQIYHTTPSVKRGRTLGDMVHESYLNLI